MNLNLFDESMIVQNILEKAVKGIYLVVGILKKINYMERNVGQILNKTILVTDCRKIKVVHFLSI